MSVRFDASDEVARSRVSYEGLDESSTDFKPERMAL